MKNTECRDAQDQLVEYIEGELDKTQQALLARHLETCADCQKELKEIERLRATLAREQAPELGAAFWESFPDRVWRAYQSEQITERQRGAGLQGLLERLRLALTAPVLIPAVALSLVIGLALFFALESPGTPGIAAFQAKIHSGENLAQLARRSGTELPAETRFGFSATGAPVSFFRVGHWYAESLAYAAGGDTDTARQRLAAIAEQLGDAPAGLSALTHGNPSRTNIAALEPELARLATGPRDAVLFQTGGQLMNLLLSVAARDPAMLRAVAPEIRRLRQELEPLGVAPGAVRNLDVLADLLAGNDLSDRDYAKAARLIRDTQLILM